MNDLVERLIDIYNDTCAGDMPTIKDAIDEIERLRKRIKELEAERDEWKGKYEWCCQKLREAADADEEWIDADRTS